jgi:hypothetical protein
MAVVPAKLDIRILLERHGAGRSSPAAATTVAHARPGFTIHGRAGTLDTVPVRRGAQDFAHAPEPSALASVS